MKFIYSILAMLTFIPAVVACPRQERVSGEIKYYEYMHLGTMATPYFYVKVYRGDSGEPLIALLQNSTMVQVYSAPEEVFGTIKEMVRSGRLRRLKNHYKPMVRILDGWTWNIWIYYEKGMIVSGGFNSRPARKQDAAIEAINGYIKDCTVGKEPVDSIPYRKFRGWDD